MDKKLTLSLNQSIIEQAKIYAKTNKISLSKLIESYLATITINATKNSEITPLVKSLSGVIQLDESTNMDKEYTDYLIEKYK